MVKKIWGARGMHWTRSEKDAEFAQKLGKFQRFVAVFPQECMDQLAYVWPNLTASFLARWEASEICTGDPCGPHSARRPTRWRWYPQTTGACTTRQEPARWPAWLPNSTFATDTIVRCAVGGRPAVLAELAELLQAVEAGERPAAFCGSGSVAV